MSLALYYSPGACSLACHLALEEAGAAFEARRVSIADGSNRSPEYLRVNPHGSVPALVVDDETITEGPAILGFIGRSFPAAGLLPEDETRAAQVLSRIAWLSSTVHVAFARVFRPERIVPDASAHEAVKAAARAALAEHFAEIDAMLDGREWMAGERFGVADGYPFVFLRWARRAGIDVAAHKNWQAHAWRMLDRPAVKHATEREGLQAAEWMATV